MIEVVEQHHIVLYDSAIDPLLTIDLDSAAPDLLDTVAGSALHVGQRSVAVEMIVAVEHRTAAVVQAQKHLPQHHRWQHKDFGYMRRPERGVVHVVPIVVALDGILC